MNIRLKIWIDNKGLKSAHFADKIGVNRATISHILSGRNKPSIDFLEKLLRYFPDLNANWLITGVGDMYDNQEMKKPESTRSINKIVVFFDDQSFDELKP